LKSWFDVKQAEVNNVNWLIQLMVSVFISSNNRLKQKCCGSLQSPSYILYALFDWFGLSMLKLIPTLKPVSVGVIIILKNWTP
jgi:hypothetical protein